MPRSTVEVKIGIQSVPRELILETSFSGDEVEAAVRSAIADGSVLVLPDDKGGKVMVPAEKIGYLELGGSAARRIGFGS